MPATVAPLATDNVAAPQSRNFARSVEAMAQAGAPGFADYLAAVKGASATTANDNSSPSSTPVKATTSNRVGAGSTDVPEDDNFGLSDVLDLINPLQHIPIISSLYREMTGDTIKPVARVVGDMLFGGLVGGPIITGAISVASIAYEQQTGEDPITRVANALFGGGEDDQSEAAVASKSPEVVAPVASVAQAAAPVVVPSSTPSPASSAAIQTAGIAATPLAPTAGASSGAVVPTPYGGVMDLSAVNHVPTAASPVAQTRLGHTIYASPALSGTARAAAWQAAQQHSQAVAAAASASTSALASASSMALPAATPMPVFTPVTDTTAASQPVAGGASAAAPVSDQTLGGLMHDQAKASAQGNAIPPALVQDMMRMALDKYKAASDLSEGISLSGTN